MNFSEFENCKLSTDEILSNINTFGEENQKEILKFIYSLLFHTDIKIENAIDLGKIVSAYLGYTEGTFAVMEM